MNQEIDEVERERRATEKRGLLLSWWAERRPDAPAIVCATGTVSFAELDGRANQVVRALRSRGLVAGDSVAIICQNRPEFVEVWAACARAGWRMTPINFHLTGGEAGYIVDDCEAKAFVADVELAGAASPAAASAPRCTVLLAVGGPIAGFEDYDAAVAGEDPSPIDDPARGSAMLYTSGTTGRPKGVWRDRQAPHLNASGYVEGDLHLCTGPLYHAAPLGISLAGPLLNGVGTVLMGAWDAEETLHLVDRHHVTHTHMVPTMFHRLLALPDAVRSKYDLSSLRHVQHGAAPCPVSVKQRMIEWLGPVVYEYYAATEGLGTAVTSEVWLSKPGTVGKIDPPDQVYVGDDTGEPVATGDVGVIYLKSPPKYRFEYFNDADKTASTYRDDRAYFTLGDMGYVDDEGFLFLTDRSANLIISGGVNIYPAEVDAVLLDHPAVGDVATIGVPNEEWGEEVKAVVELRSGVAPSPELAAELVQFCRARLAKLKCPRTVDFVKELPRADNGKIYKRLLRDQYRRQEEQAPSTE